MSIFLLSAATLAWEITLTRVFAITQFYHFAFLAVNVALLGFGASGTALTLRPRWTATDPPAADGRQPALQRRLERVAIAFAVTLLAGYLFINNLPFDSYAIAWDRRQIWLLVAYYLALAIPFFCTGLAVGMALAMQPGEANRIYAANLLGSACGALMVPMILPWLGMPSIIFVISSGALLSGVVLRKERPGWRTALYMLGFILLLMTAVLRPAASILHLSPYKGLSQTLNYPDSRIIQEVDTAIARLTAVESDGIRSLPGLSFQYRGELPTQFGLFVDGDDLSPVLDTTSPIDWGFLDYLPEALAYDLMPNGPALVLNPRGGLAIWQALDGGDVMRPVIAIESDPAVPEVIGELLRSHSPYFPAQIELAAEAARSFLRSDERQFGIIHLALTQPYRPVTSGAFSLGEEYDLTVEAIFAYLDHLSPDGLLVLSRWLQTPPSESVRTLALLAEGLRVYGIDRPNEHIVALRGVQTVTFLVKRLPWTPAELATVRDFSLSRRLDLSLAPDLRGDEINRFNILPEPYYESAFTDLLAAKNPQTIYDRQPFAVAPPTDNHPFFFHFFRWSQTPTVLATLGQSWQPFGGSGILVLVALLGLALVASTLLILAPLAANAWLERDAPDAAGRHVGSLRVFLYFGALGLGFLLVEIPLIQRFIFFLGYPTLALAVVLGGILFWSGLGSLTVPRLAWRTALIALLLVLAAYQFWLDDLFNLLLGASQRLRLLTALILLAPLGLLMGMPFPWGLRWLARTAPSLTTWAWAINGCTSVIASVLAALLALQWGFGLVLWLGLLAYALALVAIWRPATSMASRPRDRRLPTARSAPRPG